jgi:hypothetical protein
MDKWKKLTKFQKFTTNTNNTNNTNNHSFNFFFTKLFILNYKNFQFSINKPKEPTKFDSKQSKPNFKINFFFNLKILFSSELSGIKINAQPPPII